MVIAYNCEELDVASVDCSIGDTYLSLARYNEAVLSYEKDLIAFKLTNMKFIQRITTVKL
jgi:hypothetical protein